MILLDTCILLRVAAQEAIPPTIRAALDREPWVVSSLTAWEIAIKSNLGKLPLPQAPDAWWRQAIETFTLVVEPFTDRQALIAGALPLHHADPFDRGIIATAIAGGLPLATVDARLEAYRDCPGLQLIRIA